MKIQLLCMCYNSADLIIQSLNSYEKYVDRFMLFVDNKTTDNTYQLIKNFKKSTDKKVVISNFHFAGFAESRNECLDISYDINYDYTIFIDDSFELIDGGSLRDQLEQLLNDRYVQAISFKIRRNKTIYNSIRIIKTRSKIRYDGDIHEVFASEEHHVITNSFIDDVSCENHTKRSNDRVYYDLDRLKGKTDQRSLYYISNCKIKLYIYGELDYISAIKSINNRLAVNDTDYEERFLCYINMGNIYLNEKFDELCVLSYLKAANEFKGRSGEAYFYAYLMTEKVEYLEKAKENYLLKNSRLPVDFTYYGKDGQIMREWSTKQSRELTY